MVKEMSLLTYVVGGYMDDHQPDEKENINSLIEKLF